jgi:hypothetical protein
MRTNVPQPQWDHPGYIVFGRDEHDRKRAAWFSPREQHLARMASNMAGFWLFEPSIKTPARLKEWLPRGTRLESGRFVIPRVRQGLYEKLCDLEHMARRARAYTHDADEVEVISTEGAPITEEAAAILEELTAAFKGHDGNEPEEG